MTTFWRQTGILSLVGLGLGTLMFLGPHWGHVEALQAVREGDLPGACQESQYQRFHETVDRGRPLVVLLHGLSNCPWEMADLGNALFEAGYDVMAPRMPGHGTNSADLESLTLADIHAFEARVITQAFTRSERVILAGTSYGGLLAIHAAQTFPGMVRGVALLSPFLASTYDTILRVACVGAESPGVLSLLPGGGIGEDVVMRLRFLPNGASSPSSQPDRRFWYTEIPLRTVCLGRQVAGRVQAALSSYTIPTLLFTSDADEVVSGPAVRDMFRSVRSVTDVWYRASEGVRHQLAPRNRSVNPRWDSMRDELLRFVEGLR